MTNITTQQLHDLLMLRAELRERYVDKKHLEPGGFHSASALDQWIMCEVDSIRAAAKFLLEDHDTHVPELSIPSWTVGEYEVRRMEIMNGKSKEEK